MGTKQLASFKPAHWSLVAKKHPAKHNVTALEHPPYFLDLSLPTFSLFPHHRKCSERTTIHEHQGSHCDKSTDRGIKEQFPGMLPKAL
jgi:hypothetical protein